MGDQRMHKIPAASVRTLPTADIAPNPHNPRRLFDAEPMEVLKNSVNKLGILVPLTVYERTGADAAKHKEPFVLLDGERRWRCAQALKLTAVPAVVVEAPTEEQNILTMFHIHNVREGWQLMPTALKLELLMKRLNERNERALHELTQLSLPQIRRCKILLTFPKRFQEMMLAPPEERLKADFFIEMNRLRQIAIDDQMEPWVKRGDANCIDLVLKKYMDEVIVSVTEFRRVAEIWRASKTDKKKARFSAELERFLGTPSMGIQDFTVPGATFAKTAKEISRSARRLTAQLQDAEIEAIASDEDTITLLKDLMALIRERLDKGLLIGVRDAQQP